MNAQEKQSTGLITAVLRLRCPLCRQGQIFSRPFTMNEHCAHCNTKFEREPGYFLMGIFMGYVIYALIFLPLTLIFYLNGAGWWGYALLIGLIVLLMPIVFHYARSLWLHVDQILDPRPEE